MAPRAVAGLSALPLAGLLAACGGGEAQPGEAGGLASASGAAPMPFPQGLLRSAEAPLRRHILQAGSAPLSVTASGPTTPTPTELFNWAEIHYPHFFPGRQTDQQFAPYVYRGYPQTGNYVGVANGMVYVLGPLIGNLEVPVAVGRLEEFTAAVNAGRFAASDEQAARFLLHATLGATTQDIADVRRLGYEAWLQQQFDTPPSASNWSWLVAKGYETSLTQPSSLAGVDNQVWQRLISAPDSLRQRVALALSQIFVVGVGGSTGAYRQFRLAAYWDLLAEHAFGNFRTLLEAVTLSPAMGNYLNMAGNQKENPATGRMPDENYAREVMQLFTIGLVKLNPDGTPQLDGQGHPIDSYTETDVSQLARIFTGWNFDRTPGVTQLEQQRRPMVLTASLHSTGDVTVLGTRIPGTLDGRARLGMAMDLLAQHPNVGPFIGRQLIQRLVCSNPSPAYVARVAAVFDRNSRGVRGDLGAVVRAVLLDDEARAEDRLQLPATGKLREPLLRMLQWARTFKASSLSGNWNVGDLSDPATRLGQSPQRSPSVFNFFRPGYVPPNTALATAAMVAPEMQLTTETSVAGYLNYLQTLTAARHADLRPDYSAELALAANPTALVVRLNLLLAAGQLAPDTFSLIVSAVSSIAATTATGQANRVATAVMLVMASPDYLHQK